MSLFVVEWLQKAHSTQRKGKYYMTENVFYSDDTLFAHHTREEMPNPNDYYMHTHDRFEVFYFIGGRAQFVVEGSAYELKEGDVVICRNSESHHIQLLSADPYERISIHFPPALLKSFDVESSLLAPFLQRDLGQGNRFRREDFRDASYETYIRKALATHEDEAISRFALLSNLGGFLVELRCAWETRSNAPVEQPKDPLVAEMIHYINAHLFERLSLPDVAQQFFLSQAYISKRFADATGSSIWNYIMVKRLHRARAAIRNGRGIGTVYLECGYHDYSSFYRAYRKLFGVAPTEDKPRKKKSEKS